MTGSLEHLGGDRWRVRIYVGRRDGRDVMRTRSFRAAGERAAKRKSSAVVESLRADLATATKPGTVADLIEQWLVHRAANGASPTTMKSHGYRAARITADLGHIALDDLTPRHIDAWYAELRGEDVGTEEKPRRRTESSIHHYHRVLTAALRQGERWGMVDRVATRNATPPGRGNHRIVVPANATIVALLDGCAPDLRFAVAFAAMTGLRRGELVGLRWSDVDDDIVHVRRSIVEDGGRLFTKSTKTGRERDVKLGAEAVAALVAHRARLEEAARQLGSTLAADGPLLPNLAADPTGAVPRRPGWLSLAWRRRCDELGVKVRLHDLRHWHATTLIDRGIPVTTVAARLGHAQTSTTLNVYAHAVRETDEAAAALIDDVFRALPPGVHA